MKTYTFKIKLIEKGEKHPHILSVVHCPLEVLFDSLKEFKELNELHNTILKDNSNSALIYITASDYLINNSEDYVSNDYVLCKYCAIIESKSLTELLTHKCYYDFVSDLAVAKSEKKVLFGDLVED